MWTHLTSLAIRTLWCSWMKPLYKLGIMNFEDNYGQSEKSEELGPTSILGAEITHNPIFLWHEINSLLYTVEVMHTFDRRAKFSSSSSLSLSCKISNCKRPCDTLKDSLNRSGVEQLESVSLSSEAIETIRSNSSFFDSSCCSWLTYVQEMHLFTKRFSLQIPQFSLNCGNPLKTVPRISI